MKFWRVLKLQPIPPYWAFKGMIFGKICLFSLKVLYKEEYLEILTLLAILEQV